MLAIVIPYYKITFLEQTLLSLANQTDKRFKVYMGNDASPDDPSELLERFQNSFPLLYHRFETNKGGNALVEQWERCIDLTAGEEWIMILGDDDVLDHNVVENWYRNYEKFQGKTNVVRFATQLIFEDNGTRSAVFTHPEWEKASETYFQKMKGKTRSSLSEYVFTRKAYQQYGFYQYPLAWYSDDRAWIELSDDKPVYTINDSRVYVRLSAENISGKTDNEVLKKEAKRLYFRDFILNKLYLFTKKQRLELLVACEIALKDQRQIPLNEWCRLAGLYCSNFQPLAVLKFTRRFCKNFLFRWN